MSRPSKFGRMGHSFDSEGTSVITSPPLSPREPHGVHHHAAGGPGAVTHADPVAQPMYYVQSPSRDSFTFNEGDSLSQSFAAKSSPSGSPLASPLHKSFASKPHQHQAVPGYYNVGNPRPGSRRVLPQPNNVATAPAPAPAPVAAPPAAHSLAGGPKKGYQPWNGGTIQEEEESQYPGSSGRRGISRWCAVFLSIIFAILCAVIVGFTYWLVCRPSAPRVQVKNISFRSFSIAAGDDPTGVPTQVLTVNCTTTLNYDNPSKYFGFHVSSPDVKLFFQQIVVAEGESEKFFQKKKSAGIISVDVHASRSPVYGAGPNLVSTFTSGDGLPLQLHIGVQSEAHVIWKIVQPKYKSRIACDLVLDTNSTIGSSSSTGLLKILSQDCHRG